MNRDFTFVSSFLFFFFFFLSSGFAVCTRATSTHAQVSWNLSSRTERIWSDARAGNIAFEEYSYVDFSVQYEYLIKTFVFRMFVHCNFNTSYN